MRMKLKEICEHLNGDLSGDGDIEITGVSGIKEALPTQITFVANPKYLAAIATTQAGAIIIGHGVNGNGKPTIRVDNPYWAFVKVLEMFAWDKNHQALPGVHETAILGKNVKLGAIVSQSKRSPISVTTLKLEMTPLSTPLSTSAKEPR